MELRDYQTRAIEELRDGYRSGIRSQLLVMPTGSGKTVLFSAMTASAAARGNRTWVVAHRSELVDQISACLVQFHVEHAVVASGTPRGVEMAPTPTHVCMVQTLLRRMESMQPPNFIIVDEAHHAVGTSGWKKVIDAYPSARILGVTATPERLSGEGLGETFDAMVEGPTTRELIAAGHLSGYRLFAPPTTLDLRGVRQMGGDYSRKQLEERLAKSTIVGDAISHYVKHAAGKRAIAFCVTVAHAQATAAAFRARGIASESIDGAMDAPERRAILDRFRRGVTMVLTSCELVSEGFDLPAVEAALLLRPTQSLALYLQQIGRALRPMQGKTSAIILDHAGNSLKHGLPDDERAWSLEGWAAKRGKNATGEYPVRTCAVCYGVMPASATICSSCGAKLPVQERKIEVVSAELVEAQREQQRIEAKQARRDQGRTHTMEELIALGRSRGYAHPAAWAWHVFNSRKRA